MNQLLLTLQTIRDTDVSCLFLGETGTGKSFLAQYLHDISRRQQRPFVTVNCACMPRELMESELFGYVKGAFSGAVGTKPGLVEAADGGTLFLDEISELPYEMQAKLLYFLQEKEFLPVGAPGRRPWTSASWPPPTGTSGRWWPTAPFGRTSTSASTPWS